MPARRRYHLLRDAVDLWSARHAFQHAGALAFYTLFSMAPLVIIVVTVTGAVLGEEAVRGELSTQIEDVIGEQPARAVEEAVRQSRIEEAGVLPTLLGAGALLFGATTVFAQMQASLNQFWGVAAHPSRSGILVFLATRLLSLGLVLIIGFLLLTSLVLSIVVVAFVRYAEHWIPVPPLVVASVDLTLSVLIATALFAMIFKVLPDVRLRWRDVAEGAAITAFLFVVGQYLISLYLTTTAPASAYGAAGSLVMVLFWVYYSSLILFFGVAFTKVRILRRGARIVPKPTAVRMKVQILEEEQNGRVTKVEEVD
jgi:membrane protein